MSATDVRTHAIIVRSTARRVRSQEKWLSAVGVTLKGSASVLADITLPRDRAGGIVRDAARRRCAMSVDREGRVREFLEIEVLLLLDGDPDGEDRAALELARRFVFLAHRIAAVATDAQAITGQRELAELGLQVALRNDLFVDIERGLAERLAMRAGFLANELHAERVLARLELGRDELLLRLDAEEVVDVVQLLILDEQRMAAEARAVGKDDARAVRVLDLHIGDDLVGAAAHIDGDGLWYRRRPRIVDVAFARRLF